MGQFRAFTMRPHILLLSITSLASASIVTDRSSLPEGAWMPKELGRFHIPHAGFIEAYDNEEGKKDLYITTFNPALPYFHDPVFMIPNPGEKLNSVSGWANEVVTLGVKASAYWPNFPVKMNKEVVGFEGVVQTSGFLVPGKNTGKLELYNRNDNARGPIDIAAGQDKDWSYHWVIWKDVDDDGLIDALTARFRVPGFIEGGDPISQLLRFHRQPLPLWWINGPREESAFLAKRGVQEHPNCFWDAAQAVDRDIRGRRRCPLHHVPQI